MGGLDWKDLARRRLEVPPGNALGPSARFTTTRESFRIDKATHRDGAFITLAIGWSLGREIAHGHGCYCHAFRQGSSRLQPALGDAFCCFEVDPRSKLARPERASGSSGRRTFGRARSLWPMCWRSLFQGASDAARAFGEDSEPSRAVGCALGHSAGIGWHLWRITACLNTFAYCWTHN
jgi:hypothetical protein